MRYYAITVLLCFGMLAVGSPLPDGAVAERESAPQAGWADDWSLNRAPLAGEVKREARGDLERRQLKHDGSGGMLKPSLSSMFPYRQLLIAEQGRSEERPREVDSVEGRREMPRVEEARRNVEGGEEAVPIRGRRK